VESIDLLERSLRCRYVDTIGAGPEAAATPGQGAD
jgi:hypothetical protein